MEQELKRIIDDSIYDNIMSFGAVLVEGPKGCGKSYTAKKYAKSVLDLRDEDIFKACVETAHNNADRLLCGENPRLIIEWQKTPAIWDCSRYSIDERNEVGLYIYTGQSSDYYNVFHNGYGRINSIYMWPMSLYESGESKGLISLCELIDHPETFKSCKSDLYTDNLLNAMRRGGWPKCVCNPNEATETINDLINKICDVDVPLIVGKSANPNIAKEIIKFYSLNTCKSTRGLFNYVNEKIPVSMPTLNKYILALKQLYIIEDFTAWPCQLCDVSHKVMTCRHNIVDPSLAIHSLGTKDEDINLNYRLANQLFKCLCYREIKVYTENHRSKIYYYEEDRNGIQVDCVLKCSYEKYALICFRLGVNDMDSGISSVNKLEEKILEYNKKAGKTEIMPPVIKMVITGTRYGYRRKDGVFIIPIDCLKN